MVREEERRKVKEFVTKYMNAEIALPEAYVEILRNLEDDLISEDERDLWYTQYGIIQEGICHAYMLEHGYEYVIVDSRYKWVKQEL